MVGDEVVISFDWRVASRRLSSTPSQSEMVPLFLELPAPAYKAIPTEVRFGPEIEPVSKTPRLPMMVPSGLNNVSAGSKLVCSVNNVTAAMLGSITDGNKKGSDESTLFLPKGKQWVQMDLGQRQEVFAIVIWHSHNQPKAYHDVIVQVADDSAFIENVRTLFNNDSDNSSELGVGTDFEYVETYEGKLIDAQGVDGRYLRFYSKGSSESSLNEYTEIEVYARHRSGNR